MNDFKIIAATPEHTEGIVALLQSSLGESSTPKSLAYWQWKHEQNIFGKSYTFVAIQNNTIVGVRALMQWQWTKGTEQLKTVRAVDTATHPAYQGKGIFKALTLHAIHYCSDQNIQLVYNTPNQKSMPGYLKMGWQKANTLPVNIKWPFTKPALYEPQKVLNLLHDYAFGLQMPQFKFHQNNTTDPIGWHTALSLPYLQWRFANCPVVPYGLLAQNGLFGFVFSIKPRQLWQELRICTAWCLPGAEHLAQKALYKLCTQVRPAFVSFAQSVYTPPMNQLIPGIGVPFIKGPQVTLKSLSANIPDGWSNYTLWQPSLGDMELF